MSRANQKYVVFFDIDGTLLVTGGAGQHAFYATFRKDFGITDPVDGVPFAGRSDRAIALDLMKLNAIEPSEENWRRFHDSYTQQLATSLQVKQGTMLPGVMELLSEIEQLDHVALGLITGNVEAGARAKLRQFGLAEKFSFGGFGDQHCDRDDIARTAMESAQRHLDATVSGTATAVGGSMVIGDTVHDISCAHSIGAFAVGVTTGSVSRAELDAAGADLVLDDLSQSEKLLAEIHAANTH